MTAKKPKKTAEKQPRLANPALSEKEARARARVLFKKMHPDHREDWMDTAIIESVEKAAKDAKLGKEPTLVVKHLHTLISKWDEVQ